MSIQQMLIGGAAVVNPTPYKIVAVGSAGPTSQANGNSGSGSLTRPTGTITAGFTRLAFSWFSAGNTNGNYYLTTAGSSTSLYGQAYAKGSTFLGVSSAYSTVNQQITFSYLGPVQFGNKTIDISGTDATTTKSGEVFNASSFTPTNTAGGTLVFVVVSATQCTDITITGGEGAGSAISTTTNTGQLTFDNNWICIQNMTSATYSGYHAVFAYYRSCDATGTSSPIIVTGTPTSGGTPTFVCGVTTITTDKWAGGSCNPGVTPSPTPTPSITPSITVTTSITPSITRTPSPTPSITPTISVTPTFTPTTTATPTVTPTISITPSTTPPPLADTGWIPVTVAQGSNIVNPGNLSALDGQFATMNITSGVNYLVTSSGLAAAIAAIPSGSTFAGVSVRTQYTQPAFSSQTPGVFLTLDGTTIQGSGSNGFTMPQAGSSTSQVVGGVGSNFGNSALSLSSFSTGTAGVAYTSTSSFGSVTLSVDFIEIKVFYRTVGGVTPTPSPTPVTPTPTPTMSPSAPSASETSWIPATAMLSGTFSNVATGLASSDGVFATATYSSFDSQYSYFTLPGLAAALSGATTITGIGIRVTGYRTGDAPTVEQVGFSYDGTGQAGMESATFGSTNTAVTYHGAGDTWGTSPVPTVAQLRGANFSIVLWLWASFSGSTTYNIDYLEMKVYYS